MPMFPALNTMNMGSYCAAVWVLLTCAAQGVLVVTSSVDDARRTAEADLRSDIRNRSVVREKVAPTTLSDSGTPVVELLIYLGVVIVHEVDDATQTTHAVLSLSLKWRDPLLTWDPSNYSGVELVELATEEMWTPDVQITNTFGQVQLVDGAKAVSLNHRGYVHFERNALVDIYCPMDLTLYPFDQQVCDILIGSYSKVYLRIHAKMGFEALSEVVDNINVHSGWELLSSKVDNYTLDNVTFPKLSMTLRRKTTFYTVCLVVPMVLTSYINTLVFLLPPQSGEKVSFLVSLFVSTSVFISYFTDVMPRSLDVVPNVMVLMLGVIVQSFLIFLATVLVLRRYHAEQQEQEHHTDLTARETTPDDAKNDNQLSSMSCCQTRIGSEGTSAAPVSAPQTMLEVESSADRPRIKVLGGLQAKHLDYVFFGLAVTANTIFLFVLLRNTLR